MSYKLNTGSSDFKQVSGSSITKTSTNVDGGVVKSASTDGDRVSTSGLSLVNQEAYGSQVFVTDDVKKSISAGPIAVMTPGNYVGQKLNSSLAGQINNKLVSGGDLSPNVNIHSRKVYRNFNVATLIRAGLWDVFSGTFTGDTAAMAAAIVEDSAAIGTDKVTVPNVDGQGINGTLSYQLQSGSQQSEYKEVSDIPVLTILEESDIGTDAATIEVTVALGYVREGTLHAYYREDGDTAWILAESTVVSASDDYDFDLTDLEEDTTYEYKFEFVYGTNVIETEVDSFTTDEE